MLTIISISLGLLVIVAGLLLLAKTKKEELGGLFTFSSYAVITSGILLVSYAFVACMISCQSGKRNCGNYAYSQCHGSGYGGGSCASYRRGCSKLQYGAASCGRDTHCSKGGCCKSSCSKASKSCREGKKCCSRSKGKRKEIQRNSNKETDGEEDVDVTIEIIE